ncbi:cysteinyl-tRNA synthetase, unknown class [Chitinophaga sp. CF118]|uniref:endo alpha-1,4 polygalactosaminidase n=1 Tax=Chitinophaga sp. CF118 TaxID=1884367 RepID=UPI0008E8F53E|nr:endo alpha-1,4 polygalactosaminidase [Chitinophaga sp. CF118]SFD15734.1 cysteinyl-tRNA synthetase, unknown class [Chitinophaga sp. CF118]
MKTRKKLLFALPMLLSILSCSKTEKVSLSQSEKLAQARVQAAIDYRAEMRNFVIGISQYAKAQNPQFAIIPQNGIELITTNGEADGTLAQTYINAIDGVGQEDLFYGYDSDNVPTPSDDNLYLREFLNRIKTTKKVLVTDYCSSKTNMDKSYSSNNTNGYVSFAADHRELNNIPSYPATPYGVNSNNITSLSLAKNFLYLINPENYSTKTQFINAVKATNYDVILMDLFLGSTEFTAAEIDQLKTKANGGKRLVICYMSIGEAEDYRYYWKSTWKVGSPSFIVAENPDWPGNYKVQYWNADWKNIISGNDTSYAKKLLNSHFDGVYLDIIDGFEYFEN